MKTFFTILIILFSFLNIFGQSDSLNLLLKTTTDTTRVNLLNKLSSEYLQDDSNLCCKYAFEALTLSKKLQYISGINDSYINIYKYYKNIHKYDSTIIILNELLDFNTENKDSAKIGYALYLIANIYYIKDNFAKSLTYNLTALPILKKYGRKNIASDVLLDLGRIYYYSKSPDNSLKYYKQSLEIAQNIKDTIRIAKIYSWTGYAYSQKNNYKLSLEYHKKALEFAKTTGVKSAIAIYTSSVGDSYIDLKQFENALSFILKANELFKKINHKEGYAWTLMSSSSCYQELGNFDKSIINSEKALKISKKYGYLLISEKACNNLYLAYKSKKISNKALFFLELQNSYSDSLFTKGKLSKIAEIQTKFEIEKTVMQKKILQNEIDINSQKLKIEKYQNRILFSLIIIFIIIAILIFYFLRLKNNSLKQKNEIYKKEKLLKEKQAEINKTQQELMKVELKNTKLEKQHLKGELEFKNKELINFALHLTQKNKFFDEFKNELNIIKKKYKQKDINTLYIRLNQMMQIDTEKEKFQIHVEEVHQSFFHTLNKKFPNLTKGDKRLLALLMMNLSSKEIARIINISPSSVNTKRYRLRKKLNIDSDENLIEFVKSI